jgi:pilus assembly protein CpaE
MSGQPATGALHIAPVPRISLQAFCDSPDLAAAIEAAGADRRMDKAHVKVHMGGAPAAIEAYRGAPTPNVIVIEASHDHDALHLHLDDLAEFCDSGTKVVIAGRANDIALYRSLMARGVSEYLVMPVTVLGFIEAVSRLYASEGAEALGRVIAFTGAKGGVGASCIAHNVAWSIARDLDLQTVLVDMDLGFGTVGLDFNQDPPQGIADAVFSPERLDTNFVDRLLSKCADKLSILAAPATLERQYDIGETAFDSVLDILRSTVPCVILDVPHGWASWSRRVLVGADDVVIVAAPDLANLRNTKGLLDTLRAARPNDHQPKLVINGNGVLKRPEIEIGEFAKTVECEPIVTIPFDAKLFGTAANNGQMLAEVDGASKPASLIADLARIVTGRSEIRRQRKSILDPIVGRIIRRKAS